MRSLKHLTPRYIVNKLRHLYYIKQNPEAPWLTQQAMSLLSTWLKPTDIGFEWGSGRSTMWLAQRVKHLTSIEHDLAWHDQVKQDIRESNVKNVLLMHRSLEGDEKSEYVQAIKIKKPGEFDFILVDGRARADCLKLAVDYLKPGGLLILDNANSYLKNRSYAPDSVKQMKSEFESIYKYLCRWRYVWTSNGLWDTAFWVKPL